MRRKYAVMLLAVVLLALAVACTAAEQPRPQASEPYSIRAELLAVCIESGSPAEVEAMDEATVRALVRSPECANKIGVDVIHTLRLDGSGEYDTERIVPTPTGTAGQHEGEGLDGHEGSLSPEQMWISNSPAAPGTTRYLAPQGQVVDISAQEAFLRITEVTQNQVNRLNPPNQVTDPFTQYSFPSEYPSISLTVVQNGVVVEILGETNSSTIPWVAGAQTFTLMDVELLQGRLHISADRFYRDDGTSLYNISIRQYDGSETVELYVGPHLVAASLQNLNLPINRSWIYSDGNFIKSARYPLRHAGEEAPFTAATQSDFDRAYSTARLLNLTDYTASAWGPIYGQVWPRDDFIWTAASVHECTQSSQGNLPRGFDERHGPYYAYRSKVCLSVPVYLEIALKDPLGRGLQALHMLNRYNDPDVLYHPTREPTETTTPRQQTQLIYQDWWNGYGIRAFGKPENVASAIRTLIFGHLVARLCFQDGDLWACERLQEVAGILRQVQWGVAPYERYHGATNFSPNLLLPSAQGAPYIAWVPPETTASANLGLVSYQSPGAPVGFRLVEPSQGPVSEFIEDLGMPPEDGERKVANYESSAAYRQFWRVIAYYQFPELFDQYPDEMGNQLWLPRGVIRLQAGQNLITIPAETTGEWQVSAHDVLVQTNALQVCRLQANATACHESGEDEFTDNFTIVPGQGYLVIMPYDFPWSYPGLGMSTPVRIALQPGTSYVGIPVFKEPYVMLRASDLIGLAIQQGCRQIELQRLIGPDQWEKSTEHDFVLTNIEGYAISSATACSFMPYK